MAASILQTLQRDFAVLRALTKMTHSADSHAERLEEFYQPQANHYDFFREKLLHGRPILVDEIVARAAHKGTWIDLGGGTGGLATLVAQKDSLGSTDLHIVDLSRSLLHEARKKAELLGCRNFKLHEVDVNNFEGIKAGSADLVTLSYALTMIPDWFLSVRKALELLRPGGMLGVTDFYVSRKFPSQNIKHGWAKRSLLPLWFAADNVHLSVDHLPFLESVSKREFVVEKTGSIPYLPMVKAPYYVFIGRAL